MDTILKFDTNTDTKVDIDAKCERTFMVKFCDETEKCNKASEFWHWIDIYNFM